MDELKIHSRTRQWDGWVKVDEVKFQRQEADGSWSEPLKRLVVECGDAAAVLLQSSEDDRLLLVTQARMPLERHADLFPIELVAGKVDPGEQPSETALREVQEEVGLAIGELTPIAAIYPSPGVVSEMVSIYYATFDGPPERTDETEKEGVTFVWLTPQEAFAKLDDGSIRDAKTVVALQWLRSRA